MVSTNRGRNCLATRLDVYKRQLMLYIAFLPFMLIYGWGIRKPMRRYGEQEQQDVYKRQVLDSLYRDHYMIIGHSYCSSLLWEIA